MEHPMTGIVWNMGQPPETQRGKRLLLIASPASGNFDAGADRRPDIFVGHFGKGVEGYVLARISGTPAEMRREMHVKYWAEIDLPDGAEVRSLTDSDIAG